MQENTNFSDLKITLKTTLLMATKLVQDILAIAKLETKLAAMSFFTIIVLFFVCIMLCFATWLALLIGLTIFLLHSGYSWPWVLLQVAGFNIILLGFSVWVMKRCAKNLFFSATRKQFQKHSLIGKGDKYAKQSEETNPIA